MDQLIEQIPTRKKQALAALCLAQFCTAKKISHPFITRIIEHLLSVLVTSDLPEWNSKSIRFEPKNSQRELIRAVLPADVPESLFYELLSAVLEVGYLNMYTRPSNRPLEQLRAVFEALKNTGVRIPSFKKRFYTQGNEDTLYHSGWGIPADAATYEKVLSAYRRIANIKEMAELKLLTARARTAYSLACLERLARRFNYTSPKYKELLDLLWSFTETKHYGAWNSIVLSDKWGDYFNYGTWLGTNHTQGNLLSKTDPFADAPEAVVGIMGLCALIGESHLYGAFQSHFSEPYLEKLLAIMDDHAVPLPPMDRFQKNSLKIAGKGKEMGFAAPRSFYVGNQDERRMKFWMLVSHFYSEPGKLHLVFSDPKWTRFAESFNNFDRLVHEQDRGVLDAELPPDLCRQALSLSTQKYVIEQGNLYEIPDPDSLPVKNCLTALEVFDSYGGACLEEVREYGSWRIPTNRSSRRAK